MSEVDLPQGTETHRAVREPTKVLSDDGASKGNSSSDGKLHDNLYVYLRIRTDVAGSSGVAAV